jgi:hypothetical protein
MADSYYELLGVPERASASEIRRAHAERTRKVSAAVMGRRRVTSELTLLDDALRVLTDESQRNAYDQALRDAAVEDKPTMMSVVAGVMTKGAVRMLEGSTTDDLARRGEGGPVPDIASEDLDWSGWQRGFSLQVGQWNLAMAWAAGVMLDLVYSIIFVNAFGSANVNSYIYMPLFLISIVVVPAVAALKGRHWFFWAVMALGGGLLWPLFPNHGAFSHVVLVAVLVAEPGKPTCPNCQKLVQRAIAECPNCRVDLRAQPE